MSPQSVPPQPSGSPTDPRLATLEPATLAVVRETVPMNALGEFFGRAFSATMAAAQAQGVAVVGPPLGIYFGMPSDVVEVAAGFPTARPVQPGGGVTVETLPGGRAVQVLHRGPYDTMRQTYDRLMAWMGQQGLRPADVMWESYLNEPSPDAPQDTETLITWPVVEEAR